MYAFACLIFVALAYTVQGAPSTHIVGGTDAPAGKYPYQVSLRKNNRHFCGGSIINEYNILTAAHCVSDESAKDIQVHAGTIFLNETGEVYQASNIVANSAFDRILLVNDVAVIHLANPIRFNNRVQPIKLANDNTDLEGKSCILTGWGRLRLGGAVPNNLQQIELRIYSQKKCATAHWRVKDTHICTYTKTGEGACHGDSGGPLAVDGVQVGIVSFGLPCAAGSPDVFTRVTSFVVWIETHLRR